MLQNPQFSITLREFDTSFLNGQSHHLVVKTVPVAVKTALSAVISACQTTVVVHAVLRAFLVQTLVALDPHMRHNEVSIVILDIRKRK